MPAGILREAAGENQLDLVPVGGGCAQVGLNSSAMLCATQVFGVLRGLGAVVSAGGFPTAVIAALSSSRNC